MKPTKQEILINYLNNGKNLVTFYQGELFFGEIYIRQRETTFELCFDKMDNATHSAFDEENRRSIEFINFSNYSDLVTCLSSKFGLTILEFKKNKRKFSSFND